MTMQLYPSETLGKTSFTSGANLTFHPWVPVVGPTGRRNVILGVLLKVILTDVDVATADVQGEDVIKLFPQLRVEDYGGTRIDLSGQALRHILHLLYGPQRWHESADLAQATPQVTETEFSVYLPFAKPYERRPEDWAIGADVMGDIVIQGPTQSTLDIGTSAVTLNDLSYKCIAICREEDSIETKMRDVMSETEMRTTSEHAIACHGRYLSEAIAYADGASGGASMANWTAHRLGQGIMPEDISVDEMLSLYRYWRSVGDSGNTVGAELYGNDPFLAARARVVYMTPPGTKFFENPYVKRTVLLRATNTVANTQIVTRQIEPTSTKEEAHLMSLHGIRSWRAKTAGKTRRDLDRWGAKARFMNKVGVPA